jgi:hypothetical protein
MNRWFRNRHATCSCEHVTSQHVELDYPLAHHVAVVLQLIANSTVKVVDTILRQREVNKRCLIALYPFFSA